MCKKCGEPLHSAVEEAYQRCARCLEISAVRGVSSLAKLVETEKRLDEELNSEDTH